MSGTIHLCMFCLGDTDRFIVVQRGPLIHGFSVCYDAECLVDLRMWLRPDTVLVGSKKWE